jgi:DNA-binding transcriptional regulator YhcF (GntR family)
MIYQNERAIYVRIAERICDDILSGKYAEEERVPSVRELAAEYEVNTNTALRAFDILQRDGILAQQRGIGMLVERGARRRIRAARRKTFLELDMPDFFRRLKLLGMTIEDVVEAWQKAENGREPE